MKRSLYILPLVAGLSACGGSGSDDTIVTPPTPTPLAKVISGELTNKTATTLSINNQKPIDISGASVNPIVSRTQSQLDLDKLKLGMQITISTNGEVGKSIIFDSLMTAKVEEINANESLMIAGMTVLTKNARIEDGLKAKDLNKKFVEISGYPIDGNTIQATYIEIEEDDNGNVTELEGLVTDIQSNSFKLGKVTVEALGQLPSNIKQGDWVEVEGILAVNEIGKSYTLSAKASDIEIDNPSYDGLLGDDDDLEVEGIISWVSPQMDHLVINQNQSVAILNSTKFEKGNKNNLKVGANIEVEGTWDLAAANIKASEIEFDNKGDATDIENAEFEVPGTPVFNSELNTLTMNDISFTLTRYTEFENVVKNDLTGKTWVEMSGYEQNGQYIVLEVESDNDNEQYEIEGIVTTINEVKSLFGYIANDNSLNNYNVGQRVECNLVNRELSECKLENEDDND
ncbi:hypothetical protein FJQ87_16625 [Shewanella sp. SNU WT4]|uniref:DUF5666 domain-containing protein n=1 Tax=Shewanella sp. SNU WT4 TaxID=2590015 RepID=UPI00112C5056|nr:DUF5666 domain-containing protein [Shewanella sp. SNU WT4]QDF68072.1 hypothetical protein FJQ87_16625 [Shewanella sp. SNU WT4]